MALIRVLIADDHPMVRRALSDLIQRAADMELVAAAANGAEAVDLVRQHSPDVVLMDLAMPGVSGIEAIRRLRDVTPPARIVVLTSYLEPTLVLEAVDAGAIGYVLKDAEPEAVLDGIRAAMRGESPMSPRAVRVVLESRQATRTPGGLTSRHVEILTLLARGLGNKQIAAELGISEKTVKSHMTRIFDIIGVDDRTQAALWARRRGLE